MKFRMHLAIVALSILWGFVAHAHPMGTRLWGHGMTITPTPDALAIDYTVEVPLTKLAVMMNRFKQLHGIDAMGPKDEARFNQEMIDHLISGLKVNVGGKEAHRSWNPHYARRHAAGQLGFFNYELHLLVPLSPDDDGERVEILNDNFPMQRAVFHNAIATRPGAYAEDALVPASQGWEQGEDNRRVAFTYRRGEAPIGAGAHERDAGFGHRKQGDADLLALLGRTDLSGRVLWIALLSALFLGAAHALSPGHGKALVAAYLVGSRGTARHAALLGLIVTFTHIGSVVILGIAGLLLAEYIVPEYYAPFISLASGAMIVGIGVWLFLRRFQAFRRKGHHHQHAAPAAPSWRQLAWLGISGGIVPCPTATVVMLTAIAIGRPAMGLALIACFSVGLAVVLILVGMLSVRASSLFSRFDRGGALSKWLPIASAIVVTALGLIIIYRGFWIEWITWSW